ncbi:MAG: recombinase family protein [Hyphomicrobium sp.]|nr:recombinase family protein [Hyphomicrobium sp.]
MNRIACAIYTRKSSEEGLEQAFNSLDAQREACEAYITSQKHAGWVPVRDLYDDGGLSGGTLERPALKRLLADIEAGKVRVVVVYKVDRLTRSLADFAKIVEVFDAHGASFVSVTQAFNTTTSMGRLTLNMLLSFAQFEREVTGERIRDKIAASKAKGLWMGGVVPLGYDVRDRKLVINDVEGEAVRTIFRRYAELGSVRLLGPELTRLGIVGKRRTGSSGAPISRGALYQILQNRLYCGDVAFKGKVYPGQHDAIVDAELWRIAQEKLAANRQARSLSVGAEAPSLLCGLIFDGDGNRMTPTHANKRGRRYRYYISASLLDRGETGPNAMRVPASDVEGVVLDRLRSLLSEPKAVADALLPLEPGAAPLDRALRRAARLASRWLSLPPDEVRTLVHKNITRVVLTPDRIAIEIGTAGLGDTLGVDVTTADTSQQTVVLSVAAALRRAGKGKRLIIGERNRAAINPHLVRLLQEAFSTKDLLLANTDESMNAITARLGKSKGHMTLLLRLSYLAPSIVDDILGGRAPTNLWPHRMMRMSKDLPLDWAGQRRFLRFDHAEPA